MKLETQIMDAIRIGNRFSELNSSARNADNLLAAVRFNLFGACGITPEEKKVLFDASEILQKIISNTTEIDAREFALKNVKNS